jgi:hypothetical protein
VLRSVTHNSFKKTDGAEAEYLQGSLPPVEFVYSQAKVNQNIQHIAPATEPHGNPLQDWLQSLRMLKQRLPDDVLVLPAHGSPFRGAHARLDALIEEHTTGLGKLLELCREPRRAVDAFPALFKAGISDSNLIMATGESVAHLNYLLHEGAIDVETDRDGVLWYRRC